jgi:hypothetical protein
MVSPTVTREPEGCTEEGAVRHETGHGAEHPDTISRVSKDNFRCKRGIALYKRYATKLRNTAPWTYLVPSQSGKGIYLVYMKPGEKSCSCPDYAMHHQPDEEGQEAFLCKHYFAARLWKAKSAECAACKGRYLTRLMKEAGEGHLTFYADDYLCKARLGKHGLGEVA